jgi:hypothetical protein
MMERENMTATQFVEGDGQSYPSLLRALWLAGQGKWDHAHEIAQEDDSREAAWVHAYLHRVEGDAFNANYWYRRAGRPAQTGDLRAEWETIVLEFLQNPR